MRPIDADALNLDYEVETAEERAKTHACDSISRQAAIDAIEKAKTARTEDGEIYVAKINAEMNITLLPSVDRLQGWVDKAISIIDAMQKEGIIDYEQAWEFRMRARMKGADDE